MLFDFDQEIYDETMKSVGREEGINQGLREGKREGLSEGIKGSIDILRNMNIPEKEIAEKIMLQYNLKNEEVGKYM